LFFHHLDLKETIFNSWSFLGSCAFLAMALKTTPGYKIGASKELFLEQTTGSP